VLVALALLLGSTPAGAAPAPDAPASDAARPTVDPAAPTPTAPPPGGPPQGYGPGGVTVGGEALDTRGTVVVDGAPPLPDGVVAAGWLVADAGTGDVLAARDPHGRHLPASTLKTLTLLTLVHRLDPATVVEGTAEDEAMEGSRVGMVAGGRYPVSLLFAALVMQSGNDAANALARAAGGAEVTVAAMNARALEMGAFDTVVGTPSGLDVAGQSSSPYDLALFFRALVADPVTAAILRTPTAEMPAAGGRAGFQIQNDNPLAGSPGNLGGKTGFTDAARHTFVTAAERDGRRLVVSVMGTERVPLRAADQAALLLDWGFAVPPSRGGVGRLVASAAEVPAPAPTAVSTPGGPAGVAAGPVAPGAPAEEGPPALGLLALGAAAVAVVAATVIGRRRAVRPTPPARGPAARGRRRPPGTGSAGSRSRRP
jgi:D-alanyl-D-alanine carboxypeptidase (penicillin-binding protein 5/6)